MNKDGFAGHLPSNESMVDFAVLEAALADLHRITSRNRTRFQARIKNLIRLGLAPDAQRGRGKRASFNSNNIMRFASALQFVAAGVGPEDLVRLLASVWPEMRAAFLEIQERVQRDKTPLLMACTFGCLGGLTTDGSMHATIVVSPDAKSLGLGALRRAIVFNLTDLFTNTEVAISGILRAPFRLDLR